MYKFFFLSVFLSFVLNVSLYAQFKCTYNFHCDTIFNIITILMPDSLILTPPDELKEWGEKQELNQSLHLENHTWGNFSISFFAKKEYANCELSKIVKENFEKTKINLSPGKGFIVDSNINIILSSGIEKVKFDSIGFIESFVPYGMNEGAYVLDFFYPTRTGGIEGVFVTSNCPYGMSHAMAFRWMRSLRKISQLE